MKSGQEYCEHTETSITKNIEYKQELKRNLKLFSSYY